jgi:hypothetical protein
MKINYLILPLAILLTIACCCLPIGGWGLAYEHNLTKNYSVWAADETEQACIVKKETPDSESAGCVISAMVVEYGWNADFIIAKQHPQKSDQTIDTRVTNWYIIETKNEQVHGPLTEEEFINLKNKLNVPEELTFTQTIQP